MGFIVSSALPNRFIRKTISSEHAIKSSALSRPVRRYRLIGVAKVRLSDVGAIEKANSVERLVLPRIAHPRRVIELGAGTGPIITELERRNFADVYVAVDYSPDAAEYMKRNLTNIEIFRADSALAYSSK